MNADHCIVYTTYLSEVGVVDMSKHVEEQTMDFANQNVEIWRKLVSMLEMECQVKKVVK